MSSYYKECFVEQIYHFDALEMWEKLNTGSKVKLAYDNEKSIIKVIYEMDDDAKCIGILSDDDAKGILPMLKEGWADMFFGRIIFEDNMKENGRLRIVIYIATKRA